MSSKVPIWERTGKGDILHREMGQAGERIWADIVNGEDVSGKRFNDWKGTPPIDVIAQNGIGYQVKTVTNPENEIHFSGRARQYKGNILNEKRPFGDAAGKLDAIERWLKLHGLKGWLIVLLLDEDSGRCVVYSKPGVHNIRIRQMEAIGSFDNNTGEFRLLKTAPKEFIPPLVPSIAQTSERYPYIPVRFRGRYGRELALFPHDRTVPVRGHARRKR